MIKFLQFFRINNAEKAQIISVEIINLTGLITLILKVSDE